MQASVGYAAFGYTWTSQELLITGAILLAIAGVMLIFSRRKRIALHRSLVTDELMLHLSRMADALECQARLPIQPALPDIAKRPEDAPAPKLTEPAHSIMYSMFGR